MNHALRLCCNARKLKFVKRDFVSKFAPREEQKGQSKVDFNTY